MIKINKLDYLIKYLLEENKNIKLENLPTNDLEKKNLYRSLCNIRDAKSISNEYLKIEDEYLKEELNKKTVTDADNIETISKTIPNCSIENSDKICLWRGDITCLRIDSIVNAANSRGLGCFVPCHKCIDNQIHTFSGVKLRNECNEIMKNKNYYLPTGHAFITSGYNLPAKFVIHTVGPIVYDEVTEKEEIGLLNAYSNSLLIAQQNNIKTIAFPCISTGEFRFPKEEAVKYAVLAVENFIKENPNSLEKIVFNVYSDEDYKIYENYFKKDMIK